MRGATARKIRKKIFGEGSQATVDRREYGRYKTGQVVNLGKRVQYQLAKKEMRK